MKPDNQAGSSANLRRCISFIAIWSCVVSVAFSDTQVPPFASHDAQQVSGDKASQLLEVAYRSEKAAYDAIHTWKGQGHLAEVVVLDGVSISANRNDEYPGILSPDQPGGRVPVRYIDGPLHHEREFKITFEVDRTGRLVHSSCESVGAAKIISLESNETYAGNRHFEQWNLGRPDGTYTKRPGQHAGEFRGLPSSTRPDRPATNVIIRTESKPLNRRLFGSTRSSFDPGVAFYDGGHRIDELIKLYSEQVAKPELSDLFNIFQSADERFVYIEKVYLAGNSNRKNPCRITLDAEQSFLPIEVVDLMDGIVLKQVRWSYEQVGELTVPGSYEVTKRNSKNVLQVHRLCTFTTDNINMEVAPETFELASLKPQDGDRLLDRIEKKVFVFQEGQPVAVEAAMLPAELTYNNVNRSLLIWVNVIAFVAAAIVWLLRRRNKLADSTSEPRV